MDCELFRVMKGICQIVCKCEKYWKWKFVKSEARIEKTELFINLKKKKKKVKI